MSTQNVLFNAALDLVTGPPLAVHIAMLEGDLLTAAAGALIARVVQDFAATYQGRPRLVADWRP